MSSWNQFPLIRLFPFFVLGIMVAVLHQEYHPILNAVLLFLVICLVVLTKAKSLNSSYRNRWIYGVFSSLFLVISGYQLTVLRSGKPDPQHIYHTLSQEEDHCLLGTIVDSPEKKEKYWKVALEVNALNQDTHWISKSGIILLYLKHKPDKPSLLYGDKLVVRTRLIEPNATRNPGGFNFRGYLSTKQIYLLGYVKEENWEKVQGTSGYPIRRLAFLLQQKSLSYLKKMGFGNDSFGVASALLIGDRQHIQPETRMAFSSAGTMHILAVSGLHVGIIYLLFSSLFKYFNGRWAKIIKTLLLLFVLWFYALITGLSPSVVRAATMFSFIVIGKSINKHTDILNIVFSSLFLLLIIDPYLISSIGFQLSYSAVIAIVVFYPWLYERFSFKIWLLDKMWSISCVSICAQIGTLPFVLLYFNQFPNYFLFSNLLIIPLVPIIIIAGLLAFLFYTVPFISTGFEFLFRWSVELLIQIVGIFDRLPYSVTRNIFPDQMDTAMLYLVILLLGFWLLNKRKWAFVFALGLCFCLFGKLMLDKSFQSVQKVFIVYDTQNHSLYDIILNDHCLSIGPINTVSSRTRIEIENNRARMGVTKHSSLPVTLKVDSLNGKTLFVFREFVHLGDKTIVLPREKYQTTEQSAVIADLLVVSNDYQGDLKQLEMLFAPKSIVFDSTIKGKKLNNWLKACAEMEINAYSVYNSGAFVAKL